jgi:hypothetical protein
LAIVQESYELIFFGIGSDVVVIHLARFWIFEKFDTQGEEQVFTSASLIPHFDVSIAQLECICREWYVDTSTHGIIDSFFCQREVSDARDVSISAFERRNEKYNRENGRKKYRSEQEDFLVWKRILRWYWFWTCDESFHVPFQRIILFCPLQATERYFLSLPGQDTK